MASKKKKDSSSKRPFYPKVFFMGSYTASNADIESYQKHKG